MSRKALSTLGWQQPAGSWRWLTIPYLSLDEVEGKTHPEKNGLDDGTRNYPPAGSEESAQTEQQIVYETEDHLAKANDLINKDMTDINRVFEESTLQNAEDTFTDLKNKSDKEFQHYTIQLQPELQKLRVAERQQLRNLKYFKAKNGIEKLASYPDSLWFHAALISLCMLGECFANMYFFSAGSELGLLGGFLQALVISIANVGVSLLAGRLALSNLHHINKIRVGLGALGIGIWLTGTGFYHLLVAHYRDLLSIDPDSALIKTLDKFREAPLHYESMDSIILLIIGLLIAIVAFIEGYRLDDPYPGYGKEDREYKKKVKEYEDKEADIRKKLSNSIVEAESQIKVRLSGYEAKDKKMSDLVNVAASVVEHFGNYYEHVDDIVNAAVSKYREANRKIRTAADPASFSRMPVVKRVLKTKQLSEKLEQFKRIKDVSERQLKIIKENAAKALSDLTEKTNKMLEQIDRLADEIDNKAEQEVNRLNQAA